MSSVLCITRTRAPKGPVPLPTGTGRFWRGEVRARRAMGVVPRKPRMEVAAGIWHVYARGNDRRLLFRDDDDRHAYLRLLGAVTTFRRWRTMAYCLMDNHLH